MADSVVNVSGYDASYGIDAYLVHSTPTTTDYRQIVSLGGDSSGAGSTATVTSGALTTSGHDATVHAELERILTKNTEIDTAIDTIDGVLDNILTKNTEIDTVLDSSKTVLDNILTKNTEIDTAIDTIDGVLDSILTKNTEIDAVLDNSLTKQTEIDTAIDTIDGVLDNILTKNTEIDTVLDSSKTVLDNILTKNTEIDTAIDTLDGVLDNVLTKNTEIDAVLDTIKVDTEAIETAVEGTLKVEVNPATTAYLSHVYIDEDGSADNPQSNTEILAAPGASNKLVVYGIQGSLGTGGASDYGHWYLSDGNTTAATTIWVGRIATTVPLNFSITFPYGVALTANTALELTSTEGSGNIFINAVIYYRTEAT